MHWKTCFFPTNNRFPTRQKELAQCSRFRTTFTSKILFHKLPRLWNELPPVCHQITSKHICKTTIKTSLLDSYSNQITCNYDRCNVWNINREHVRYDMCLLWIHYSCVLVKIMVKCNITWHWDRFKNFSCLNLLPPPTVPPPPPDHHQASFFSTLGDIGRQPLWLNVTSNIIMILLCKSYICK